MKNLKTMTKFIGVLVLVVALYGCGEEEVPVVGTLPVADAGPDQNSATGATVRLDGTGSTDADGDPLTFQWSLVAVPTGSSATILNEDQVIASFVPDVAGTYIARLEVNDGNNAGVADEVTIEVIEETGELVEIDSDVDEDTVWEDVFTDPARADYRVTRSIAANAVLTIAPGVVVEFDEDVSLFVPSGGPAIIANGTSAQPVTFTSSGKASGLLWKGIYISSASSLNSFDHTVIEFSANSPFNFTGTDYPAAIGVEPGAKVSIKNSVIANNDGYGIYVNSNGELNEFENNIFRDNVTGVGLRANEVEDIDDASTFTNNSAADVEIFNSTLSDTKTSVWQALSNDSKFRVSGSLTIQGTLTLSPGLKMELDEDVFLFVDGGAFAVNGTASERIELTTSNLNGGLLWKGIYIASSSNLNSFDFADITYAGNSTFNFTGTDYPAAIGVEPGAKVSVSNSAISNNDGYGIYVNSGGELNEFENNTFADNVTAVGLRADEVEDIDGATSFSNNSSADVEIFGSTLSDAKNSTWQKLDGNTSYRVSGNLNIDGELTLAAGASFEFDENVSLVIDGSLQAIGTSAERITMTTSNVGGQIRWKGIYINSASSLNEIEFADISFAGNSAWNFTGTDFAAAVGIDVNQSLTITNSSISNSGGYGIYNKGSINADAGSSNTFTNNPEGNFFN